MNKILGEKFPPLAPLCFFRLKCDLKYGKEMGKKHILPSTSELLGEEKFADVAMGWHEEGIFGKVTVHHPFEEAVYPNYEAGDAIEIFLDTRDLKEAGFPTKFCHHFLLLPQEVQGIRALELSRFRAEDQRPLCDPLLIQVDTENSSRKYTVSFHFPTVVLHGYDPRAFDRLGMTYCIHRPKGERQHFALSSKFAPVAQNPSLWATLKLVR
jgi:hypothetical protein